MYQTVRSYCLCRDPPKITCAAQNATFKNHPREFLRHKNHLYRIILNPSNMKYNIKTRKHLLVTGYRIFKNFQNLKFCLTHSLPDHNHKPRAQTKQHTFIILHHNNKLTSGVCLLGFQRVYALCTLSFLLSLIRLVVFFFKH